MVGRGIRRLRAAFATALAASTFGLVPFASAVPAATRSIRPALRPATMLFDDEFGGTHLDGSKWNTCYFWATHDGCTNNPGLELEWYRPSQVTVGAGMLSLTAVADSTHPDLRYTSGMVSTGDCCGKPLRFAFLYGYMEMRAKLPPGHGMWPAFYKLTVAAPIPRLGAAYFASTLGSERRRHEAVPI